MNTQNFLKHAIEWAGRLRREKRGWYTPRKLTGRPDMYLGPDGLAPEFPSDGDLMLGKLMLVVTEVSEAAESVRLCDFVHFSEEIADVYIRLNDIVEALGIDIQEEITKKMDKNEKRVPKHGKLTNL